MTRDALPRPQFESLRAGDARTFVLLAEAHRHELQVHCYRMLGSLQDAEDVVQETLLRAWQRLETFTQPISFRAWLYKIATNVCLDKLGKRPRRQLPTLMYPPTDVPQEFAARPPEAASLWIEPYPDELIADVEANPEARYATRESITLAFLVALQALTPRQRAVLLLIDVLDWHADEVAQALDLRVAGVNSTLHRARVALSKTYHAEELDALRVTPDTAATREALNRYLRAWEDADIATLVALLKKDATVSMPPSPVWYRGRAAIRAFMANAFFTGDAEGRWKLLPTRANGQPALGLYRRDQGRGNYVPFTLHVISLKRQRVANVISFIRPELFGRFGLPGELPL